MQKPQENNESPAPEDAQGPADQTANPDAVKPKEIGGREGPDPTRYGDWEKAGRCIDF